MIFAIFADSALDFAKIFRLRTGFSNFDIRTTPFTIHYGYEILGIILHGKEIGKLGSFAVSAS